MQNPGYGYPANTAGGHGSGMLSGAEIRQLEAASAAEFGHCSSRAWPATTSSEAAGELFQRPGLPVRSKCQHLAQVFGVEVFLILKAEIFDELTDEARPMGRCFRYRSRRHVH